MDSSYLSRPVLKTDFDNLWDTVVSEAEKGAGADLQREMAIVRVGQLRRKTNITIDSRSLCFRLMI